MKPKSHLAFLCSCTNRLYSLCGPDLVSRNLTANSTGLALSCPMDIALNDQMVDARNNFPITCTSNNTNAPITTPATLFKSDDVNQPTGAVAVAAYSIP